MAIPVLFVALFFAVAMTPLVRQLAIRLDFVAYPKSDRAHQDITPLMGGVAIYLSLMLPMLGSAFLILLPVFNPLIDQTLLITELFAIIGCGTLIAGVGLRDDWKPISPPIKIFFQALVVLILVSITDVKIVLPVAAPLNLFLTLGWFLYIINAFNYLDNMDGIASMVALIAALFFTMIAVINQQFLVAAFAAAVTGTSFGFLRYNLFIEEKKIFMGDAGSLLLGFILAVIGIKLRFPVESPWITWPVPVLVLGIPLFDTGLVFISRLRRGRRFLQGGLDHTSHRLARLQLGRFGTPFALGLIGTGLGSAALIVMFSDLLNSIAIQITAMSFGLYSLYKLEFAASYEIRTGESPEHPQN